MVMQKQHSLSTKLVTIGAVLLFVALLSIGLTLWVTWQLEGGAAAVNEAGRMRMQIWRLNSTAQSKHSEKAVADLVNEFTNSLALLRAGDPVRPLFMPVTDEVEARFSSVQAHWKSKRGIWSGKSSPDIDQALACSRMAINPQGFFNTATVAIHASTTRASTHAVARVFHPKRGRSATMPNPM